MERSESRNTRTSGKILGKHVLKPRKPWMSQEILEHIDILDI